MKITFAPATAAKVAACGLAATGILALSGTAFAGNLAAPATPTANGSSVTPNGPNPTGSNPAGDTTFQLSIPNQSFCPGDTASGAYHVDTFTIPATDDPSNISWQTGEPVLTNPDGTTQQYDTLIANNAPYTNVNTAMTTGQILQPFPTFDFSRLFNSTARGQAAIYPTGTYLAGIACVDTLGVTQNYYDTTVAFDQTGQTYTFLAPTGAPTALPEVPLAVGLPLGALVLAGGAVALQRRRKASAAA